MTTVDNHRASVTDQSPRSVPRSASSPTAPRTGCVAPTPLKSNVLQRNPDSKPQADARTARGVVDQATMD